MGRENTIVTGNASVNNVNFNTPTVPSFTPISKTTYGRVVTVYNDRSIDFELIQKNNNPSAVNNKNVKTGQAKPLRPYSTRLPVVGEVVPLVEASATSIVTKEGMFDNTLRYDDPIGFWDTVNDNRAFENATIPSNGTDTKGLSITDIKKNTLGF